MGNTSLEIRTKSFDDADVKDIHDLIGDCTDVVVTYGLDERMKICKVVSFFIKKDISFEEVAAGNGEAMRLCGSVSLYKSFVYRVKNKMLKLCGIDYWSVLLKTIEGFAVKGDVHDLRKKK